MTRPLPSTSPAVVPRTEGRRRCLLWVCVAAASWWGSAAAREAGAAREASGGDDEQPPATAPEREDVRYGEEIIVTAPSRLPDLWRRDQPGLEVVDPDELAASGARTLQEALRLLPGANLTDEQGNRFQEDLTLRGLTASPVTGLSQGFSVFLDGVRVNEPTAEEVNFDLIPLGDVERIEIVHGPNVIFGRNTLGGAIHVVTRRGRAEPEAEVELEGGSWRYQQARGRVSGASGPVDGYLSVAESTEQGWRTAGASRSFRAFGKAGLRLGDTDATLSYQYQQDRLEEPGSLPRSMLEQDRTQNYTAGDFFRPSLHLVILNVRQRLPAGLTLAANGAFRALDAEQFNASWLGPDTRLFDSMQSWSAALQLDHRASFGPLRHQLTVGGEVTRNGVHVEVHQEPNAQFDTSTDGVPLPALSSRLDDRQVAAAAFAQEYLRLASGPVKGLALTAALRFDRISHAIVDSSPDDPGKASGDVALSHWSPAVGLSWAFDRRWAVSASFTHGFRAPAFLELTCADPKAPCIGLQAGVAPDTSLAPLRPVQSNAWEAGLRAAPLDALLLTFDVYRIGLTDDIYSVTAPGTTQIFFQNVGATRREGVEASAQVDLQVVEIEAGYAYTHATFRNDLTLATPRTEEGVQEVHAGATMPLVPAHRLNVTLRVRPTSWLSLSVGATYVGSQVFRGDEANVAPRLDAYLVSRAGAEAKWRWHGHWTASFRAVNLFDAKYETFGTYATNGRAPGQPIEPFLTPGAPLRLVAGVRWELGG